MRFVKEKYLSHETIAFFIYQEVRINFYSYVLLAPCS